MNIDSTDAPNSIYNGTWKQQNKQEYIMNEFKLIYHKSYWCIIESKTSKLHAFACSFGLHPLTIYKCEWFFCNGPNPNDFHFSADLQEDYNNPYNLESDIGFDFFIRIHYSRVIYYIDPSTNMIEHSGAKEKHGKLGKRFCWICQKSFSANNFVTQHMKKKHRCNHMLDATLQSVCNFIANDY